LRDILTYRLDELEQELGEGHPAVLGLQGLITMIGYMPPRTVTSSTKLKERLRAKEELQKKLWLLYHGSPEIKQFLDTNIHLFNGRRGDPESFEMMDNLLVKQPYRLAF
jgi:(1->4)-alpha-D-glucan 1-alpha-D-glucosylmutase